LLRRRLGHDVAIGSTRAGNTPGIHRVGFDGVADRIELTHEARSRDGFAAGALLGARWLIGRRGVFAFADVLDDIVRVQRS
jgi:4-hydroxy-tetrahydrodipicolinate reductase